MVLGIPVVEDVFDLITVLDRRLSQYKQKKMGHVTILVQHAWKMQSSQNQPDGLPKTYKIRVAPRPVDQSRTLAPPPLSAHIRVTVPASIAQLVKYFNSSHDDEEIRECETAIRDVLTRLEHLVLASNISDQYRYDHIRAKLQTKTKLLVSSSKAKSQRVSSASTKESTTITSDRTRKSAAEARISVLMLTRCRSRVIRDKSLMLLCESLDTNALSSSDHEMMHLQMLWVEMVQLFRHVIDAKRKKMFEVEDNEESIEDTRINVDEHVENLLTCISLTLQRLDHAQDVGKPIQSSTLMTQSYACLLDDLKLMKTIDPYIVMLLSDIYEHVEDFANFHVREGKSKKELALDSGVSLLSQIIRMCPPKKLSNMEPQFISIMNDIHQSKNWHLGKKLILILGTAAGINMDACLMYIKFLQGLQGLHWEWRFRGVLCLGAIVCGSASPNIRRLAMEEGLIPSLCLNNDMNDSWLVRAAAVVALCDIYQQFKANVHGLLAREVMENRLKDEKHPQVIELLQRQKAKVPLEVFIKRVSFLFKYTSTTFAEAYFEMESEYHYMRKFIQKAEKNEIKYQELISKKLARPYKSLKPATIPTIQKRGSNDVTNISTRAAPPQFTNLMTVVLDTNDYHQNYKKLVFDHESYDDVIIAPDRVLPPLHSPSFLATTTGYGHHSDHGPLGAVGTGNRRKLYHPEIPDRPAPLVEAPIKIPKVFTSK